MIEKQFTAVESEQKWGYPKKLDKTLPCVANNKLQQEFPRIITGKLFRFF